jgi:hypothetical protein
MGASTIPVAGASSKTRYALTLTSGTSYTVPTGVTYLNVTLRGGGGGAGAGSNTGGAPMSGVNGSGGEIVTSTLSATAGASITYAIGAGGAANTAGGTTSFTGATSAVGGTKGTTLGAIGTIGTNYLSAMNGGNAGSNAAGGAGASGSIDVEYWV